MFSRVPVKLAQKAVAASVICGAVVLGGGGAAFATTTTTSGSTPVATRHVICARAPKALTRIDKVEAAIAKRLPKLQAAESRSTKAGHTKVAHRVAKRIHRLQKVNGRIGALATKIHARCPTATAS